MREICKVMVFVSMAMMFMGQSPVPNNLPSNYPHWWFERDIIKRTNSGETNPAWSGSYATQEEKAAFNIGQLKHVAAVARDEMEARLAGGADTEINNLVNSWTAVTSEDTDSVVIGQLKYVASLFLQRLNAVGYTEPLSGFSGNQNPASILTDWGASGASDNDKDLAVIGQLKYLFSWDLSNFASFPDADLDGLDDSWEQAIANFYGLTDHNDIDPLGNLDGGVANHAQEFARGTDATDGSDDNIVLYVDSTNGSDSYSGYAVAYDGTNGPKQSINAIFDTTLALDGDVIEAAEGTYQANTIDVQTRSLTLRPMGVVTIDTSNQ